MGATDTKTTERVERMKTLLEEARDIAAKAETDNRNLTGEERQAIESRFAEASAIKADLKAATGLGELAKDIEILEGKPAGTTVEEAKASGFKSTQGKSLGRRFVEDENVKGYLGQIVAGGGHIAKTTRVHAPPVGFRGLKAFGYQPGSGRKNLVTGASDSSAGALVQDDWRGLVDSGEYARPLTLLDVVTRGQTDSDTVEYAREDVAGITSNAAPVPEATDAGVLASHDPVSGVVTDAAGGLKPESDYALEIVTTNVRTIAHWIPATKRALSDASQVRTLIDNFLEYGLLEELEDQIMTGDGTGENLLGILNNPGIQGPVAFDTNIIRTSRKALTLCKTVGRAVANAVILNPADAETLDLTVDGQGRYYYNGPRGADGATPLWGRPVVESEAIAAGTGLIGDFRRAVVWDREQAAITATDSHLDFFVRNLVVILAEMRAAFGVLRPSAFVRFLTA